MRTLTVMLVSELVLTLMGCGVVAVAVRAGAAPEFDQEIVLAAQHSLVIHNGLPPTCTAIPTRPEPYCFVPGPERREFSVSYLTPHGIHVLVWFRLPK